MKEECKGTMQENNMKEKQKKQQQKST